MSSELYERQTASTLIHSGRIFDVYSDDVELMDGRAAKRDYISTNGAVAVVAVDEGGNVIMERQYRYAQRRVVYEIPAGKLEKGEEPEAAALRELREETGVTAEKLIPLGVYVPSPAILTEDIYVYLATGLTDGETCPDEGEFLITERVPLESLTAAIMRDEIRDGKTVFGLLKARLYLGGGA